MKKSKNDWYPKLNDEDENPSDISGFGLFMGFIVVMIYCMAIQ